MPTSQAHAKKQNTHESLQTRNLRAMPAHKTCARSKTRCRNDDGRWNKSLTSGIIDAGDDDDDVKDASTNRGIPSFVHLQVKRHRTETSHGNAKAAKVPWHV